MPEPILEDHFRAQVVLPGKSGLPEDVFVNTWYFRNDQPGLVTTDDVADTVRRVLLAFYDEAAANGGKISSYLSPVIDRANGKLRLYDLGETPPRTKIERTFPLTAVGGSPKPLPNEVAICLSFHGESNTRRQRGRVYLGPLNDSAPADYVATFNDARVSTNLIATIADRATDVMTTTENVSWVVRSEGGTKPPLDDPRTFLVEAGWVDNAFDTQRRRGFKATTRTTWG